MTRFAFIKHLIIIFCSTISFSSYSQSQLKKIKNTAKSKYPQIDNSKTAIIPFDKTSSYPFDSSFNRTKLTQHDLRSIDSLLIVCLTDYNNSIDAEHKHFSIDLKKYNYRKQIIAVTNRQGQKEVWVNCFCSTGGNNRWKTEIMNIMDGGTCYFNFKINLATKKIYDLGVNGEA